jgi:hypothetical protein
MLNEDGVAGCDDSVELHTNRQRGTLELIDPRGQAIQAQPLYSEGWTELDLVSFSAAEAVHGTSVFGGVEMVLVLVLPRPLGDGWRTALTVAGKAGF